MPKGEPLINTRSDAKDDYYNYHFRNARLNAGFTHKKLAEITGIDKKSIIAYERVRHCINETRAKKIANALGTKVEEIFPDKIREITSELRAERRGKTDVLDNALSLEDISEDLMPACNGEDTNRALFENERREEIDKALAILNFREREILRMRYGLMGDNDVYTLERIGKIFYYAGEEIRLIELRALDNLRKQKQAEY